MKQVSLYVVLYIFLQHHFVVETKKIHDVVCPDEVMRTAVTEKWNLFPHLFITDFFMSTECFCAETSTD